MKDVKTVRVNIYKVKVHTLYLTKYFKIVINIYLLYFSVQFLTMSSIRNPLSTILDKHVLTGPNYLTWLRKLKILLNSEKIAYTLTESPPVEAPTDCTPEELQAYKEWCDHDLMARCYMLTSMNDELQRRFEDAKSDADIHLHLKELFVEKT